MANDIRQKIRLEGEKQYSQALKEANRNLRTLKSELKAETAELGRNASEQQKAQVKAKNLQKQIAEQEKIVQTLQAALAEVREKYADNADEIAKYETKVNNARAALAEMQNTLDGVNDSVANSGNAMKQAAGSAQEGVIASKSFADSIASLSNVGESVSGAIEKVFTSMVQGIQGAIGEVWGDMMDLAARANDWEDLATTWNTTSENIQKWYHAVRASHNDFATLNSAMARIAVTDPQKLAEYAGVSAENYKDQWQLAMAVMDSLQGMDYDRRLEAMAEIFGSKKVEGISDLVNDWAQIQENLKEFDTENGGVGMTGEQISTMSEIAEKVDHIKETWFAFKDSFMAGALGKITLDLSSNVQGALDALIDFMDADTAEERQQALDELERNITEFFTKLGEAIGRAAEAMGQAGEELQGSENGYVQTIGRVLSGLSDVLNWFTQEGNIDTAIQGLETLAGFWIAGKGLAMVGKVAEMAANLKTIQLFRMATTGGGISAGAGTAAAGAGSGIGLAAGLGTAAMSVMVVGFTAAAIGSLGYLISGDWKKGQEERKKVEEITGANVSPGGAVKAAQDEAARNARGENGLRNILDVLTGKKELPETPAETAAAPEERRAEISTTGILLPTKKTPQGTETGFDLTDAQRAAAEAFFDAWKAWDQDQSDANGEKYDQASAEFEAAFAGQERLYNMLMDNMDVLQNQGGEKWHDIEDLPASWFRTQNTGEQLTRSDISGFSALPGLLEGAVRAGASSGVSGIQVSLDGYRVGQLVAPYVSQAIAREIMTR